MGIERFEMILPLFYVSDSIGKQPFDSAEERGGGVWQFMSSQIINFQSKYEFDLWANNVNKVDLYIYIFHKGLALA